MSFDYCSGVDHPHNNINSRNNDGMVMMSYNNQSSSPGCSSDEDVNNAAINTSGSDVEELRRGPWTVEEDIALINYIAVHGEGRWNSLARCAGLNRTGKSCRLRWLNYLRPDVRRGNITPEEQLLILELHSRWGNRWSKIAQYLPGRTDNEIKNYWRTRVQKHAKQLKCDVNSQQFKDTMRYLWMPRLVERIQASAAAASSTNSSSSINTAGHFPPQLQQQQQQYHHHQAQYSNNMITNHYSGDGDDGYNNNNLHFSVAPPPCEHLSNMTSDNASTSSSMGNQLVLSPVSTAACGGGGGGGGDYYTYAPGDAAPSMYDFQPVDQNINPNSSDNNYFNQNLAKVGQPPIGFDHFQWLLDDDVYLQGGGDYHTPGDVHVDVNLWNSVDDVNSYDQLLQHQRQLQQQFHDSTNNNCVYF